MHTEVIICGAGPTGLMLANWLQRLGVAHRILDPKPGPTKQSRALAVQARSLEIYDQLGMIDQVRDRLVPARVVQPGWRDRPTRGSIPLARLGAELSPYGGMHVLEQSENERLLLEQLRASGGKVDYGQEVIDQRERPGGVHVSVRTGDRTETLTGRWLVGADGSSSPTRERAGIAFPGSTHEQHFWVADAFEVRGLRENAVNLRLSEEHPLIGFPMTGSRHHRLVGVLPRQTEPTEEAARADLAQRFGVRWGRSEWFSPYRVHSRVAEHFRRGAVLLAGDAAHVHSPVGGQGMNTGLQDAHNLAFTLAAVIGGAPDSLLDRYETERRPVARRLVSTVDRIYAFAVDPSALARTTRRLLVPVAAPVVATMLPRLPLSRRLIGYVQQTRIRYPMPSPDRGRRSDPVVGRRLPWTGDNHQVLRSADWQVHSYGAALPAVAELPPQIRRVHRFEPRRDLGLDAERWFLIRPDGFVAAAARPAEARTIFVDVLRAQAAPAD
ncbi:FAD-dependent monooxygenase [Naumannella halotolerans]|uniref:FAD-dependent monooxygenase n=1 Tax=Naumannella halotolerans TaxID=993414 RepID=UPI00370D8350